MKIERKWEANLHVFCIMPSFPPELGFGFFCWHIKEEIPLKFAFDMGVLLAYNSSGILCSRAPIVLLTEFYCVALDFDLMLSST